LFGNKVYYTLIRRKKGSFRENIYAKNGFKSDSLDVKEAKDINVVKTELRKLLEGKLVLGVDLAEDFSALDLEFGDFSENCFDLQWHYKEESLSTRGKPIIERWSLKRMSHELLGEEIQNGVHSALEDAVSTAKVFREAYMKIMPKPCYKTPTSKFDSSDWL